MKRNRVIAATILLVNCVVVMCQTNISEHSAATFSSSRHPVPNAFGQPVSVETGNEEIPSNIGFLECTTRDLRARLAHAGTVDMVQKLESGVAMGDEAVIVGHGAPGIICTGNGDHCSGNQDMLSASTASSWQPLIEQLKGRFRTITLVGCEVGEGPLGANFLSAVAKATNATVRAPSDIVKCDTDGITILNGGIWMQVDPTSTYRPAKPQQTLEKISDTFKFKVKSDFVSVTPSDVKILSFQHRAYGQQEFQSITPSRAHSLLPLIDFANPIQISGSLGSIVTGRLTLQIVINNRAVQRGFVLLNDKMFEDRENPTVYYKTTSAFTTELNSLLR